MKDKNIIWVDWAKFIGISFVILGHLLQVPTNFSSTILGIIWHWIYLFHMPLFFVVMGYLFKNENSIAWKKILKGLVVPYLIYQMFFAPITLAAHLINGDDVIDTLQKIILGILLGDGYDTSVSYVSCLPAWFLVSTIHLKLLFSKIRITTVTASIAILVSILFSFAQKRIGFDLYGCLDTTIMAIPFFIFGIILKRVKEMINRDKLYPRLSSFAIAWGGVSY